MLKGGRWIPMGSDGWGINQLLWLIGRFKYGIYICQTLGIQWSPSGTMEGSFASMWTPSMAHCLFCTDQQCHSGDHHQSFDVTTCWPKKRVLPEGPEGPEGPDGYGLHLFLKMKAWGPASSSEHILVSFWIWNLSDVFDTQPKKISYPYFGGKQISYPYFGSLVHL
jgi:hypothetical protein